MHKIFIGVGHGGDDPGAVANGVRESDANLIIALAMEKKLKEYGFEVKLSRYSDVNDRLSSEISKCKAYQPDVAVEVHNNAGGGKGFEIYVPADSADSKKLAEYFCKEMEKIGRHIRGIKTNKNLGWTNSCPRPCVLCEGFFLDSAEGQEMKSIEKQKKMGEGYAKAVAAYFSISTKSKRDSVKEKYNFSESTMEYLDGYKYSDALYERLLE